MQAGEISTNDSMTFRTMLEDFNTQYYVAWSRFGKQNEHTQTYGYQGYVLWPMELFKCKIHNKAGKHNYILNKGRGQIGHSNNNMLYKAIPLHIEI